MAEVVDGKAPQSVAGELAEAINRRGLANAGAEGAQDGADLVLAKRPCRVEDSVFAARCLVLAGLSLFLRERIAVEAGVGVGARGEQGLVLADDVVRGLGIMVLVILQVDGAGDLALLLGLLLADDVTGLVLEGMRAIPQELLVVLIADGNDLVEQQHLVVVAPAEAETNAVVKVREVKEVPRLVDV